MATLLVSRVQVRGCIIIGIMLANLLDFMKGWGSAGRSSFLYKAAFCLLSHGWLSRTIGSIAEDVELYRDMIDWKSFKGNKIYIGVFSLLPVLNSS